MELDLSNKILITSGCSFSGGGNFNNSKFLKLELPHLYDKIEYLIEDGGHINDDSPDFKSLIREYLWTYRLEKLAGFKKSINTSAPGKGIYTAVNNIYNSIFNELINGCNSSDLYVILQIPNYVRDEVFLKDDEDQFVSIITEVVDNSDKKINYLLNHYNEFFLYRKLLNELYKLQIFCESLKIQFFCFTFDSHDLNFGILDEVKELSEYQKNNFKNTNSKFINTFKSFDEASHVSFDKIINYINYESFDGKGMQEYGQILCKNFNFMMKYPTETDDSHPTIEGNNFMAEELYKKIIKREKNL
jgi:hypothetical protein